MNYIIFFGKGIQGSAYCIIECGSPEASAHDEDYGLCAAEAEELQPLNAIAAEQLTPYRSAGVYSLVPGVFERILKRYKDLVGISCSDLVRKPRSEVRFMAEYRAFALGCHDDGNAYKSSLGKDQIRPDLPDYFLCL